MKKLCFFLSIVTVLVLINNHSIYPQQSSEKVFWMATVEVSLGRLEAYHSFNYSELIPLMEEHGYKSVAAWQTIVGDIEEVIFVAEFENMAAYQKARVSLLSSIEWQDVGRKFDSITKGINTKLLKATPYSKLQ